MMHVAVRAAAMLFVAQSCPAWACLHPTALGVSFDQAIRRSHPAADLASVEQVRIRMRKTAAEGRTEEAAKLEEEAMGLLGYRKVWLFCGTGAYTWVAKADGRFLTSGRT